MKKASKYVLATILRGFLILIPLLIVIYLASKIVHISNLIFSPLSNVIFHKSYGLLNTLTLLLLLFLMGLATKIKFLPSIEQIIIDIPVVGHILKYFNKMKGVMDIAKKRGVVFVCESGIATNTAGLSPVIIYKGKSFVPALVAGKVDCASGTKFKIIGLSFHTPFKMSMMDSDTLSLAALNWSEFLKYWPTLGTMDISKMKDLKECALQEYWDKIHPEE